MNALKDLDIFCRNHDLDPNTAASRRMWLKGDATPVLTIAEGRDLTWSEIELLTGGDIGTFSLPCPYCGPEKLNSERFQLRRPNLHSASWHCFYCGQTGNASTGEKLDPVKEAEARRRLVEQERDRKTEKTARALRIWEDAVPIAGTLAIDYLRARAIDGLPPDPDSVLRFHPACPFGTDTRPCMIALFRDAITDELRAIHRTWVGTRGKAYGRMALGPIARAAIKLWPRDGTSLVIGEGIETVLAAALHLRRENGDYLRPAWALTVANNIGGLTSRGLRSFPLIRGVRRLIILVDNDESGVGQKAAEICSQRWCDAGREVLKLIPKGSGRDFNDIVKEKIE